MTKPDDGRREARSTMNSNEAHDTAPLTNTNTGQGEARELIIKLILQTMWSPASGPVVWTDEKIDAMRKQTNLLADAILSAMLSAAPTISPIGGEGVQCRARNSYPDPLDCDWPHCGCDPHAERVMAALEEEGLTLVPSTSPRGRVADLESALRAAAMQLDYAATFASKGFDADEGQGFRDAHRQALSALSAVSGLGKEGLEADRDHASTVIGATPESAATEQAVARIMAMTDDELLAETIAAGEDPDAIAAEMRGVLNKAVADHQIKQMVDRFLAWKLPADFSPDCGISFTPYCSGSPAYPRMCEPVGTNLFTATQAEAMVRHMLARAPNSSNGDTGNRGEGS